MKRRDFLRFGSAGIAGLALGGANLGWLVKQAQAEAQANGTSWKFGVMSDTQWSNRTTDPANPASCAVNIIQTLNQEFIKHGCKFVVQCGDLCDKESWDIPDNEAYANYADPLGYAKGTKGVRTLQYRAWAAEPLYAAGIGFFPVRGNHEASATAANEVPVLWPQTTGGGDHMFGVGNVIDSNNDQLRGLSYAFDFDNVRIVLIDQFTRKDNSGSTHNNLIDQVAWVDDVLADRPSDMHAFVVAHKNVSGQNHKDLVFGSNWNSNTDTRDAFIASLQENKVGYYLSGHDHQHYRSIVTAGGKSAEQIITSSNSFKFYIPATPYQQEGERPIAAELFTIGYYIFTVDGPCVTVDFYSSSHGADYGDIDLQSSPASYSFYRRETFGYSLNGKSFEVPHGESYSSVEDSFQGTRAAILAGANGNAETAYYADPNPGTPLVKTVKTGWRERPADAASAVLKLWGIADNLSLWNASIEGLLPEENEPTAGDTYVLSLSYDAATVRPTALRTGRFCLHAKDSDGNWVNAVDRNSGGGKVFVYGPWRSSYGLGTHGVDPKTHTVWAVLNRDGELVARQS